MEWHDQSLLIPLQRLAYNLGYHPASLAIDHVSLVITFASLPILVQLLAIFVRLLAIRPNPWL
jgi:hypothetical protein